MGREIERKFLVAGDGWRAEARESRAIRQAYLHGGDRAQVRVRIVDDAQAWLTIKSGGSGLLRGEYEYAIPLDDAHELMASAIGRPIEKRRHLIPVSDGLCWEVDEFAAEHAGLIVAEIELPEEGATVPTADWLGEEVTGDRRYSNAVLAGLGDAD